MPPTPKQSPPIYDNPPPLPDILELIRTKLHESDVPGKDKAEILMNLAYVQQTEGRLELALAAYESAGAFYSGARVAHRIHWLRQNLSERSQKSGGGRDGSATPSRSEVSCAPKRPRRPQGRARGGSRP
jgi:hypothetical protein